MTKAIFDRLFWVNVTNVDLAQLKRHMTLTARSYVGDDRTVNLLEFSPDNTMVGIPRRWGIKALKDFGLDVEYNTSFPRVLWPDFKWPVIDGKEWGYRPGQREAVDAILNYFKDCNDYGALLEGKCGSGKTAMSLVIASELKTSALVLVHKSDLAEQWQNTSKLLWPGIKVGHIQRDKLEYRGCHYVTAMAQTIYSRSTYFPDDFWESFGLLILDEGHRYSAETFEYVLRKFKCKYRLGVSATWRRSDGLEPIWNYHVGTIQAQIKSIALTGKYIQPPWKDNIDKSIFQRGSYFNIAGFITALGQSSEYNKWLVQQLIESIKNDRRVVLVADRNAQLHIIYKWFLVETTKLGIKPDIGLYIGNSKDFKQSREQRDAAKKCRVVLTNFKMMAEGTDVPELDTLILASPKSDVEQTVGRIQRPSDGKKSLLVVAPVYQIKWAMQIGKKQEKMLQKLGFKKQGE